VCGDDSGRSCWSPCCFLGGIRLSGLQSLGAETKVTTGDDTQLRETPIRKLGRYGRARAGSSSDYPLFNSRLLINPSPRASLSSHGCKKLSVHSALNQMKREASFTLPGCPPVVTPQSWEVPTQLGCLQPCEPFD
jgi:hypothetical protein